MTLKQLLRPDWRKILIFVIIFVISINVPFLSMIIMGGLETEIQWYSLSLPILGCLRGRIYDWNCSGVTGFLILVIILDYLLSCLIVWVYDKLKKKR